MEDFLKEFESQVSICQFCSEETFEKVCFRCQKEYNEIFNEAVKLLIEQIGVDEFNLLAPIYLITISSRIVAEMFERTKYRRDEENG